MAGVRIKARALRWTLLAASLLFAGLGVLFLFGVDAAASLFGVPATRPESQGYVRAVGLRDLALAGYIALLTLYASARAVLLVLLVTLITPAGDLVLVRTAAEGEAGQMVLHAASGLLFAGLAAGVWTSMRSREAAERR
ncbi:DUF4267 domain-containing protein [Sphingomonas sp. S2-65]|uniref:DUF4267 domain-containing protein n=1 Tax=Sphingomonas sp. S2-65 TaxID=2903960 RepID=UPI001F1B1985|nr:DUF4267 domain-containing protein [Sphingomonas sp. S2-65]UYY57018.1 DUF4267 domain-containing protein [Sphingomonas sp. S2-65]